MNDLIYRQDAIEAAKDLLKYHGQDLTEELINYFSTNAMERIPAAQPEKTILTVKCELDDEESKRAIEAAKNAELELIAAQQEECEYWDNESHYCALNRPSAQPNLQPTCNQLATDCISRKAAIAKMDELMVLASETVVIAENPVCVGIASAKDAIEQLPSAQQEASFITWLLDAIWDDEMWELNWQAFPEIVCRKLAKLGYLMEKDGEYERLDW